MRAVRALLLAAAVAQLVGGCGGGPHAEPRYPGTLRPPAELGADVMMRQRLTARWGDGEGNGETVEFEAVLQKQGDALILLGLGPHGGRAFLLEHRDGRVRFEPYVDLELPFPPRFILLDVQRVFFPHLGDGRLADGAHERELDGEMVRERWREGRLVERTFRRTDGEPDGVVRVDYGEGLAPDHAPPRIELHNGWLGYSLTVETLDRTPL